MKDTASSSKTFIAYIAGLCLGGAIVYPSISGNLPIESLSQPDPIIRIILIGTAAMVAVTTGFIALYQLFILIDQ